MNEQPKPNKKPFFYYAMIAMLILMLLNAFVFPSLMTPRVTEVSYDKFLDMLSGQLQVFSRYDADVFWDALQKNGAQPLCSLTGDIHLHTLVCPDEARKARVLAALEEKGYLMGLEK